MELNPDFPGVIVGLAVLASAVLSGVTLMRWLRVPAPPQMLWLLGAPVTLAGWSLVVAISVAFRVPLRLVAAPLLLVTFATTLACLLQNVRNGLGTDTGERWRFTVLVSVALISSSVAILPYVLLGFEHYPGSRLPDGWAYIAYGQYLWTYPHGTQGNLEPLYAYTLTLLHSRHVASGLLAVLSVLHQAGDTQLASPYLQLVGVFAYASSCGAVASVSRWRAPQAALFVAVASMSGWVSNVIWANNHDNLVALALFPAIASIVLADFPLSWRHGVVLGVFTAALVHAYPEFAGLALVCCFLLYAQRALRQGGVRFDLPGLVTGTVVALVLVAPAIGPLVRFLLIQASVGIASAGPRPGAGMFPGLIEPSSVISALWALGGEHRVAHLWHAQVVAGASLSVLFLLGLVRLAVTRSWGWLGCLGLVAASIAVLLVRQRYDYGAYKLLLIGWWMVAYCLTVGVAWIVARNSQTRLVGGLAILVVAVIPVIGCARAIAAVLMLPPLSMQAYRQLESTPTFVKGEPIGLFVEDREGVEWALYYLRRARSRVGDLSGYIASAGARPLLEGDDRYPWSGIRYILTDSSDPGPVVERQDWRLVWQSGAYKLWDTAGASWAVVTDVRHEAPATGAELRVVTGAAGCARLVGAGAPAGESDAGTAGTWLQARALDGPTDSLPDADVFWLPPGVSRVHVAAPTPEDTRERLTHAALQFTSPSVTEATLENPNGLDLVDNQRFLWLGGGATRIQLTANADHPARLTADLGLGPSAAPDRTTRRLRLRLPGASSPRDIEVGAGKWVLDFVAPAGTSTLTIEPLDKVVVRVQHDPRPLLLAAANLHIAALTQPNTCAGGPALAVEP